MDSLETTAAEFANKWLDNALSRVKQELVGENEEILDRVVRQYRSIVVSRTCKKAQKWSKWNDSGPVLMPDNTRIYYRKGQVEIVVQEFAPQVRLLKFTGGLAKRAYSQGPLEKGADKDKIYHYSLALPYVIFIFKFMSGTFQKVHVAFCDRPMKRLEEKPLVPYLSNLDSELKLCLGNDFNSGLLEEGNLTQQVALILDHFWQSSFKDEWDGHYWKSKTHFQDDSRLINLDAWQAATIENPLFVIDDVNWLRSEQESFGNIVVKMCSDDPDTDVFQEELYRDLIDGFMDDLKKTFMENFAKAGEQMTVQTAQQMTQEFVELCKRYKP